MAMIERCIGEAGLARWGGAASVLWSLLWFAGTAAGQDRVVVRGSTGGRMTVVGVIEDFTGEQLTLRMLPGRVVHLYPADDVLDYETQQVAAFVQGVRAVDENRIEQAVALLETALKQEERTWVRREILAVLVRCAVRRSDFAGAGARFLAMVESDPATRHFALIPLVWGTRERTAPDARAAGQVWLDRASEAGRLIGASLLLEDERARGPAQVALRELATSVDPRIKLLAQAQAWRAQIAKGDLGELQVEQWRRRVEAMPEELRAGPSYLVGRAYASRREYELAAASFLWLPLVDDHDYPLAARACLEAGVALAAIGKPRQAAALFNEVVGRYSDTAYAGEAAELLKHPAREPGDGDNSPRPTTAND